MIINDSMTLISSTVTSDSLTAPINLPGDANSLLVEVNGTGEFSVKIEMSSDGTNFYAINELDAFTSDAVQSLSDSINLFPRLRAKIDIGSSGSVTKCKIFFRKD